MPQKQRNQNVQARYKLFKIYTPLERVKLAYSVKRLEKVIWILSVPVSNGIGSLTT